MPRVEIFGGASNWKILRTALRNDEDAMSNEKNLVRNQQPAWK